MQSSVLTAIAVAGAVLTLGVASAAVHAETTLGAPRAAANVPDLSAMLPGPDVPTRTVTVYVGKDLDGDGQPDIADPTGKAPRGEDAYGEGCFHARRDGGARSHEGVDYVASPGQAVEAPVSGYVTHVGFAYPDDQTLKYVEIENPALKLTARVFYVDPTVAVGDAVEVGRPIGHAHTLQRRYRGGITDHVHLELIDRRGRKLDAEKLIFAKNETVPATSAMGD